MCCGLRKIATDTCSDEYSDAEGWTNYVTIINNYTDIKTKCENDETIIMTYDSFILEL